MLRKRPIVPILTLDNSALQKLNSNVYESHFLDEATKQSIQDMFDREDYEKENGSGTSFYKVSDEEMWHWKGRIDATYEYIKRKQEIGYYGKDNGKFNTLILNKLKNDWEEEMKKRGLKWKG